MLDLVNSFVIRPAAAESPCVHGRIHHTPVSWGRVERKQQSPLRSPKCKMHERAHRVHFEYLIPTRLRYEYFTSRLHVHREMQFRLVVSLRFIT
jgi:hypothetical protein